MTNLEHIQSMTAEEMSQWLDAIHCDYDSSGYIGCYHCTSYGTHHADKSLIGTDEEHLYECGGCEYEHGMIAWLNSQH